MSAVVWLLLLLVVVAAAAVAVLRQRDAPPARPAPQVRGDNDLASLGLSEVRPRAAGEWDAAEAAVVPPQRGGSEAGPRGRVTLPTIPDQRSGERPPADRARPASPRAPSVEGPWGGEAVPHLIASLAAHVGGRVAVVRHDGERYRVEARSDGGPLEPVRGRPLRVRDETLRADELGGLSALVGPEARAVDLGERLVLVGGTGPAVGPYLDLLAALTPGAVPAGAPAGLDAAPGPGAPQTDGLEAAPADGVEGDGVEAQPVPRAVVIEREQEAARAEACPLAFALVTLADAEERLMGHPPEAVAVAEAELRDRLLAAPDVRRVEPFGDLLFGAFLGLDRDGAAGWCDALASSDPPLFIGAVAPADGDPAAVRAAAVQALQDAYDQRGPHVVGV